MNWKRAIGGGLLAELLVFVLVVPVYLLFGEEAETYYAVPPASFIGPFVLAWWWVPRRVGSRLILHGTVVGVVAFLSYMALIVASAAIAGTPFTQPLIYWISHGLKMLGGAGGGFMAKQRNALDVRRVREQVDAG